MLRRNFLREKIANGKPVLGTWSILPSSVCAEILALSGLDFIVIDREHGAVSFETAMNMAIACENCEVSPLVRVADLSSYEIQHALDIGAHGIHVPNVHTLKQLASVIELTKYFPLGQRGFSPFTRAARYHKQNSCEQIIKGNSTPLVAIQIESEEAINNLEKFITYPEIDIFFIGLYDLSKSLGKPGAINDPEVKALLKNSIEKIRKAGKVAGTIATCPNQIQEFLGFGINYLTYSVECEQLQTAYMSIVKQFASLI